MDGSKSFLTKRADGFHETPDGHVAITVLVSTGKTQNGGGYFEFVGDTDDQIIRLEWNDGDLLQIYPQELADVLLRRKWAKLPDAEAIDWFEGIALQFREGADDDAEKAAEAAAKAAEAAEKAAAEVAAAAEKAAAETAATEAADKVAVDKIAAEKAATKPGK